MKYAALVLATLFLILSARAPHADVLPPPPRAQEVPCADYKAALITSQKEVARWRAKAEYWQATAEYMHDLAVVLRENLKASMVKQSGAKPESKR